MKRIIVEQQTPNLYKFELNIRFYRNHCALCRKKGYWLVRTNKTYAWRLCWNHLSKREIRIIKGEIYDMPYERARNWLEQYVLNTREEAESFLLAKGEDINAQVWRTVLDDLYGNEVEETAKQQESEQATQEEEQRFEQEKEELQESGQTVFERAEKFIRDLVRGIFG